MTPNIMKILIFIFRLINYPVSVSDFSLSKVLSKVRDDFKIVSNSRFHDIEPLESLTLPIENKKKKKNKKKRLRPLFLCNLFWSE